VSRDLSNEELCARIRGYWLRVRGGETAEVRPGGGEPAVTPDGRHIKTRPIVSNLVGGMPPGVRSDDIPTVRR
jgi:hypothetical protein